MKPKFENSCLLLLSALVGLVSPASSGRCWALEDIVVSEEQQTKIITPVDRVIQLKLPIKQVGFHFEFFDQEELLAGKLSLIISRDKEQNEIVVFDNGTFADGWGPLVIQSRGKIGKNPVYFGFRSTAKYATSPRDRIDIVMVTDRQLDGIGATLRGHLPPGTYKSSAKTPWLTDAGQEGISEMIQGCAILTSWDDQWDIVVTDEQGWLPPEQAERVRANLKEMKEQRVNSTSKYGYMLGAVALIAGSLYALRKFRNTRDSTDPAV